MAHILELTHLSVAFVGRNNRLTTIVDSLDLNLRSGKLHCVAGGPGTGKTSVLKVAAGLLHPTSGIVAWNGEVLNEMSADEISDRRRTHLGFVDQQASLLDHLSALENVLLPSVPRKMSAQYRDRALLLMHDCGVFELRDARPGELSHNERFRVALVRAQLLEPPLLILDEPTLGTGRAAADDMISAIVRLRDAGTAILVASHDQALIDAADLSTSLHVREDAATR